MSLPPLQLRPVSTSHFYISGDVTIQDGAAIAPGVLIQADPDSRITIGAGVCIGIGSILHAHQGVLEIGEGANIGAEVLLIGQVTIGAKACIGSATTILNTAIESGRVIPPGSLLGDTSRQEDGLQATDTVVHPTPVTPEPELEPSTPTADPEPPNLGKPEDSLSVYGQVYVNQMLVKMFPHHQRFTHSSAQPDNPPVKSSLPKDPWED